MASYATAKVVTPYELEQNAIENALKIANDNVAAAKEQAENSLGFLRKAINSPTVPEVEDMIKKTIMEYSFNKNITIQKEGGEPVKLKEEPRHFLFPEILIPITEGIPVALIGPAGSGKSTCAGQLATALGLKYYLQNSVSGVHELAGYMDAHGKYHSTAFRAAFENGGLLFLDEVDTSDPSALKWLNTALANGHAMFPDLVDPVAAHKDFRCVIGANTFGTGADRLYVGANQLDASTLDRFVFFEFLYDNKLEKLLSGNIKWAERVQKLRAAAMKEKARVVISPRASIYGAKLLRAGWDQKVVEDRVIWKGLDPELKTRILKEAA